ncbi:hypothetical protein PoB_002600100 [Plakobranchus ocellatus]|uniref:SMB domain-containing protein n=1 Tax=Plakobranchus ocellatus TaxID=259542 RepID=A0AAV3ZU58_9GAST|nr:hypothetical protein PoB_002600100 [Plakobranchus ocellatus]
MAECRRIRTTAVFILMLLTKDVYFLYTASMILPPPLPHNTQHADQSYSDTVTTAVSSDHNQSNKEQRGDVILCEKDRNINIDSTTKDPQGLRKPIFSANMSTLKAVGTPAGQEDCDSRVNLTKPMEKPNTKDMKTFPVELETSGNSAALSFSSVDIDNMKKLHVWNQINNSIAMNTSEIVEESALLPTLENMTSQEMSTTMRNVIEKKQGTHVDTTAPNNVRNFTPKGLSTADLWTGATDVDTEQSLSHTCRGRCGEHDFLPCSCGPLCVLYHTCCENISQDCPHILMEGNSMFGDLLWSDIMCDRSGVFKITSCPRRVEENKDQIKQAEEQQEIYSQNGTVFRENFYTGKWILPDIDFKPGQDKITKPVVDSQRDVLDEFKKAALAAPVTDLATGFTFANSTIYHCHNRSNKTLSRWLLKFEYDFTNPTSLNDLQFTNSSNQYEPVFNQQILTAHMCLYDVVQSCNFTGNLAAIDISYERKCLQFFGAVSVSSVFYRNRFCALCNVDQDKTPKSLKANVLLFEKESSLHVLMSLSEDDTLKLNVITPRYLPRAVLSWSNAQCFNPNSKSDSAKNVISHTHQDASVCSVKCNNDRFTMHPDGHCKTLHTAYVAVGDDGLPLLCASAQVKLAEFISCGLESRIQTLQHPDFAPPTVMIWWDTATNKTLYVVKLNIYLPFLIQGFFTKEGEQSMENLHHVEILAKSWKNYRMSHEICPEKDIKTNARSSDMRTIATKPIHKIFVYQNNDLDHEKKRTDNLVQAVEKENTTTVCLSALQSGPYESPLLCMDGHLDENDEEEINAFQSSPCYAHLERLEPAGDSAVTGETVTFSVYGLCFLALALVVKA